MSHTNQFRWAARTGVATLVATLAAACNGGTQSMPDAFDAPTAPVDAGIDCTTTNGGDAGPPPRATCTVHLTPSGASADAGMLDDTRVQAALIQANAGDTICFDDGVFRFLRPLTLSKANITLQGTGDHAVLDFGSQSTGENSIYVTGSHFTIQYLELRNSQGNGVKVEGADYVTFRKVHARYDAGSVTANGSYSLYPVTCGHVLIEYCEVEGASDSGIYVGQSHDVIVRHNSVHGNVSGLEIENCTRSSVFDNDAYDNTAGILVFVLPLLATMGEGHAKVFHNRVYSNNRHNFCQPGGVVCGVPDGVGVMVMAAKHTEITDNAIHDNQGVGVLAVDFRAQATAPAGYDPRLQDVCIHDNVFMGNGTRPPPLLAPFTDNNGNAPDVLWDGDWDVMPATNDCTTNTAVQLCMPAAGNQGVRFTCGDARRQGMSLISNLAAHDCACAGETCTSF